ncbi:hypothetical protein BG841_02740 [Marinobacter sp. X15-166B]|nr:hypothetical protein BG841_02740 [Marinobacter sp. X15-166B]
MRILRTSIVVCWGLFSAACNADAKSVSQQYIEINIQRLESAIAECDAIASARTMPDSKVLGLLRQYRYEDVRVFLITRSALMAEECQKPHLTDLAYTIGMLEASTVFSEVEDLIASVKPLMYGKETWAVKERYLQLSEIMREELESIPYFQRPFRNIPIIEALESANKP